MAKKQEAKTPAKSEYRRFRVSILIRDRIFGNIPKPEGPPTLVSFKRDDKGLFIEGRQVKSLLREAASVTRLTKKRGLRDGIQHGLFIKPERIHLLEPDTKKNIKKPHGTLSNPVHIRLTPRGPRCAIMSADYVNRPLLETFEVWLTAPVITDDDLRRMFAVCEEVGLGAMRSQCHGKFDLLKCTLL